MEQKGDLDDTKRGPNIRILLVKEVFNIKRRPKGHPNLQKGPLGEGPGFPEGDPLGNSGVVGALCLKGSLL